MSLKFLGDRSKMYIYPWYISEYVSTKDIAKITNGIKEKKSLIIIENDFLKFYHDIDTSDKIGKYFFNKVLLDKNFLFKVIRNIYKYSEKLEIFSKEINNTQVENLSNKELLNIYSEYVKRLRVLRIWGWVPLYIDGLNESLLTDYIQANLKLYLIKINQIDKFGEYYSTLSSSEKISEVQAEELARLNLLLKIQDNKNYKEVVKFIHQNKYDSINKYKDIKKMFDLHLKDFGWLTYSYSGPSMTIEYLFKMLNDNIEKGDIKKQKNNLLDHYKNIKNEKEKLFLELGLSKDLIFLLNASSELMYIKDYRKGIYQKSYLAMDKVLEEIAKRMRASLKEIKYMIYDEVKEALIKNKSEYYRKIVKERLKKCCYTVEDGIFKIYQGEECELIINKNIKKVVEKKEKEINELKGTVAYKGKVKGVVKIILVESDVAKLKEGDILVSSSTNPDLILAMKKAAAFVTDFGGITSHAAIVSRELKKPCIVGTKIATKIFNDGDFVEVDANNGVVKKINK